MKHSAALSLVCALLPFTVPIPILQAPSGATTTVITSCVSKLSGVPRSSPRPPPWTRRSRS